MLPPKPLSALDRDPTAPHRNVDWALLALALLLNGIGAAMIYSATKGADGTQSTYLSKEVIFVLLSVGVLAACSLVAYHRLLHWAPVAYILTLGALVAVLVVGSSRKGAQAWFAFGPLQLQPSEPAKVALIVALSAYLAANRERLNAARIFVALAIAALPMALILLQPDLGTVLVFAAVTLGLLTVAGVRLRYLVALAVLGAVGVGLVLNSNMLETYQKDRLTVFITGGQKDAQGAAYNVEQSKLAIGLGGLSGRGYGRGPQTQNNFVPEQQTDFIFTAVGEELGFVGGAAVLVLFLLLSLRTLRAAHLARDDFGTLLCVGVLIMIVFQTFQNVGMSMGIMPITGIPLPFVSYGGSSLLTTYAGIGLVLNVRMHRYR
jgi:rod shape determining protein RodA